MKGELTSEDEAFLRRNRIEPLSPEQRAERDAIVQAGLQKSAEALRRAQPSRRWFSHRGFETVLFSSLALNAFLIWLVYYIIWSFFHAG